LSRSAPLTIAVNLLHARASLTGTGHYARFLIEALLDLPQQPNIIGIASHENARSFRIGGRSNYRLLRWGRPHNRVAVRRVEEWAFLNGAIRELSPSVFFGPSNFLPLWKTGPMVVTVHDMTFFTHPETIPAVRRAYWQQWTRRTLAVADEIITVSESAKADIVEHGRVDPSRITVIYNGTGPQFHIASDEGGRADRGAKLRAGFPDLPRRYVLFLGTLTAHKNVPRLVEALAHARGAGCDDIQLVLAGKRGTEFDAIANAIDRHCLGDRVHELGYVDDELLPALYENARVLVLPSFTEGFGLPIVEAMAAGTPVVTGRGGATAEVAGRAGLLVDVMDARAMGDAIRRVWSSAACHAEHRVAGIARAKKFTWAESARCHFDVFARAANKSL